MSEEDRHERMQRIRVGLTGLAVVLLIVMLATVVFTRFGQGAGAANAAQQGNATEEPLSDLGVVPARPENGATTNGVNPR